MIKRVSVLLFLNLITMQCGLCQQTRSGLGDSSAIPFSSSSSDAYGINAYPQSSSSGVPELFTRHVRFGQSSGIGASTAQTTSTTIEGMPALSGTKIHYSPPAVPSSTGVYRTPLFSESMLRTSPYTGISESSLLTPPLDVHPENLSVRGQRPFSLLQDSPTLAPAGGTSSNPVSF